MRPDETSNEPPKHGRRSLVGPRWVRMTPGVPGPRRARTVTSRRRNQQVDVHSRRPPAPLEEELDSRFEPLSLLHAYVHGTLPTSPAHPWVFLRSRYEAWYPSE